MWAPRPAQNPVRIANLRRIPRGGARRVCIGRLQHGARLARVEVPKLRPRVGRPPTSPCSWRLLKVRPGESTGADRRVRRLLRGASPLAPVRRWSSPVQSGGATHPSAPAIHSARRRSRNRWRRSTVSASLGALRSFIPRPVGCLRASKPVASRFQWEIRGKSRDVGRPLRPVASLGWAI